MLILNWFTSIESFIQQDQFGLPFPKCVFVSKDSQRDLPVPVCIEVYHSGSYNRQILLKHLWVYSYNTLQNRLLLLGEDWQRRTNLPQVTQGIHGRGRNSAQIS